MKLRLLNQKKSVQHHRHSPQAEIKYKKAQPGYDLFRGCIFLSLILIWQFADAQVRASGSRLSRLLGLRCAAASSSCRLLASVPLSITSLRVLFASSAACGAAGA